MKNKAIQLPTKYNSITHFSYYRTIKRNAVKDLMRHGISARQALIRVKEYMPYLFNSKLECDLEDNTWKIDTYTY